MASGEPLARPQGARLIGAIAVAGLLTWWLLTPGRSPQIGTDGEVRKTVDALFTALTARDLNLLDDCASRLQALSAAGQLPQPAHACVAEIIDRARSDRWQSAAEELYRFIEDQ